MTKVSINDHFSVVFDNVVWLLLEGVRKEEKCGTITSCNQFDQLLINILRMFSWSICIQMSL